MTSIAFDSILFRNVVCVQRSPPHQTHKEYTVSMGKVPLSEYDREQKRDIKALKLHEN